MSWYILIPFAFLVLAFLIKLPIGWGMFAGCVAYFLTKGMYNFAVEGVHNFAVEGVQFRATQLFSFQRRGCSIHNGRGVQHRRRIHIF